MNNCTQFALTYIGIQLNTHTYTRTNVFSCTIIALKKNNPNSSIVWIFPRKDNACNLLFQEKHRLSENLHSQNVAISTDDVSCCQRQKINLHSTGKMTSAWIRFRKPFSWSEETWLRIYKLLSPSCRWEIPNGFLCKGLQSGGNVQTSCFSPARFQSISHKKIIQIIDKY